MANDGRIDVYFHDGAGGDGSSENELDDATNQDGKKKNNKGNKAEKSAIVTGIIQYSQKTLQEATSVYADLTGNYQQQRNINGIIQGVGTVMMMTQFPMGTIAGAFSIATNIANNIVENIKANRESALLLKRSGNENINNSEVD